MNAQELRIGNWINDITGHETQVRGTTKQGIWIGDNAGPGPEVAFTPIELTPEWLQRLGIEQLGMNKFIHISSGIDLSCSYEVKYVHRLQNLYFALTGTELEIK